MERRILLIRTDRIGDLISVTPAVSVLRKNFPHAYIAVLASEYAKDVIINNPQIDEVIIKKSFFSTLKIVRERKFDTAVVFFLDAYAGLLTWLARIPLRIGPVSKIWAVFLNKRITQRRSTTPGKHEADFNLELLKPLFVFYYPAAPQIFVPRKDENKAKKNLKETFGIESADKLVIIHPGSKGSAKNWPEANYAEFVQVLIKAYPDFKFLITGGPAEQELMSRIASRSNPAPFVLKDPLKLTDFIAVINQCSLFVSNSTGPLHIAVALGKKTLSFYPNLKGCLPERWGPYGQGHTVLMPQINTCAKCGDKCEIDCMSRISVQSAVAEFGRIVTETGLNK